MREETTTAKTPPAGGELRWLIRQARPYRGLYLLRVSTVLFTSFLALLDPLILKWIIDDILPWRKAEMLVVAGGAVFTIFLFRFGLTSLSLLTDTYTGQRLAFDLRSRLLRHLQRLPPRFHLETSQGELLHRLEQDIDQICQVGGHTLAALFRIVTMTCFSLVVMLILSWKLTLILVPLVPIMMVLRRRSQKGLRRASDDVQRTSTARVGFLQGHLASIVQVQLLRREVGERRRFARRGREALEARVRRQGKELYLALSSQSALVTATALVLALGGHQVLAGALTIGGLVAFYSYLSRIFGPVETVVLLYAEMQHAGSSIRRVRHLLETKPAIVDPRVPRRTRRKGPVAAQLKGITFAYDPAQPVLRELDLTLAPGEKVALVGATGSGKSTVARLLTRQYDPLEGKVLLDHVDLRELRLRDLRARIALVSQDPLLFDASLRDNLLFAAPRAGRAELEAAVAMAQLDETLKELPAGWNEGVGPRGDRLSGGQRQRVALARAVLQDPRLLILDEATSALDGSTERRLLDALRDQVQQRTVLVIAHRLSAILWADRIVVLDQGRAVASGTHRELYGVCSLYRRLYDDQFQKDPESGSLVAVPSVAIRARGAG